MKTTLLLPTEEAQQLSQDLPGKFVTGLFLQHRNQVAVMTEAAQILDSLLPKYEVVSAQVEPHDAASSRLIIEYRLRVFTCEACGMLHTNLPEYLHFDGGMRHHRCWCSEACKQRIMVEILASIQAKRAELGNLVELGMTYLRLRHAVPNEIHACMTWTEWGELRQRCSQEYTTLRQQLTSIFAARIATYQVQEGQKEKPTLVAIEATPISLF